MHSRICWSLAYNASNAPSFACVMDGFDCDGDIVASPPKALKEKNATELRHLRTTTMSTLPRRLPKAASLQKAAASVLLRARRRRRPVPSGKQVVAGPAVRSRAQSTTARTTPIASPAPLRCTTCAKWPLLRSRLNGTTRRRRIRSGGAIW